jgi:hypothetical protein
MLAGLTRAQGAFLVLPIAFEYLYQTRSLNFRALLGLIPTLLPGAGTLGFMIYTFLLMQGTTPGQSLQGWGYQVVAPWDAVAASWSHIILNGDPVEAFNLAAIGLFSVAMLIAIRRLPLSYALFMLPNLLLLFAREMHFAPLMSVGRYLLVLFPAFVVLALYVKNKHVQRGIICISILLMVFFFYYYVHWIFVA